MTVRLLIEENRDAALALLGQAPAYNLYLSGNLLSMGFTARECRFWGDFDAVRPAAGRAQLLSAELDRLRCGRRGLGCAGRRPGRLPGAGAQATGQHGGRCQPAAPICIAIRRRRLKLRS